MGGPHTKPARRPSLQRLFDELNAQRFDAKLPRYRARRRPVPADFNKAATVGLTDYQRKRILISSRVKGEGLRLVMLHEMCHVECPTEPRMHGPCFLACLRRLAAVEPLLLPEIEEYHESRPVPGHPPGLARTAVLWGAMLDLARRVANKSWRWKGVEIELARRLDLRDTKFLDDEFPGVRAKWEYEVRRDREHQAAMLKLLAERRGESPP